MRDHPTFLDRPFAATDFFQDRQLIVQPFEGFDIHHVGGRAPVLGDQDRISVPGHSGDNVRRLALQRRDQFRFHE